MKGERVSCAFGGIAGDRLDELDASKDLGSHGGDVYPATRKRKLDRRTQLLRRKALIQVSMRPENFPGPTEAGRNLTLCCSASVLSLPNGMLCRSRTWLYKSVESFSAPPSMGCIVTSSKEFGKGTAGFFLARCSVALALDSQLNKNSGRNQRNPTEPHEQRPKPTKSNRTTVCLGEPRWTGCRCLSV